MPTWPQVGLCVALRHVATGRQVVAVTTHLSSHFQEPWRQVAPRTPHPHAPSVPLPVLLGDDAPPSRPAARRQVAQAHGVVAAGNALAAKLGADETAVVFGGDLNSIPGSGDHPCAKQHTAHLALGPTSVSRPSKKRRIWPKPGSGLHANLAEGEAPPPPRLPSFTTAGVYQLINNGRLAPSHPHLQLPAHEENALSMPNFGDALGGGAGGELRLQQPLASAYAVSLGQVGAAWSSWLVLVPPELAIPGSSGRASEGSGLFSTLASTSDPTGRLVSCRKTPYSRRG